MHIHNLEGVKLVEKLGLTRAVLAWETTYEDIKNIKENTSIELEIFVHGALCISYSGQCLMSSLIGGRSGNRGTCAGSCRQK
jgi:putative protease